MLEKKNGRGQTYEEHTLRTDRFRYENDTKAEKEALEDGLTRSLKTHKLIYVMRNENGSFTSHSHGVEMKGQAIFAVFKRGEKIK